MNIFQKFIQRNFKRIPYFFEKNTVFNMEQYNYALFGKLSSSILHDILTPLTSLLLASQIKNNNKKILQNSTKELKKYIDVLKNFTYQDTETKQTHINNEISKSILLLRHKSISHNVQIQYFEFDQIYSKIYPLHIYQIIVNLISNAIEASAYSKTKKVVLTIKKFDSYFEIRCKDFGAGIPDIILKSIGKEIKSTKSNLRGFGLYSVYHTVEKILNGKVEVYTKENSGTYFVCKIPIL